MLNVVDTVGLFRFRGGDEYLRTDRPRWWVHVLKKCSAQSIPFFLPGKDSVGLTDERLTEPQIQEDSRGVRPGPGSVEQLFTDAGIQTSLNMLTSVTDRPSS